jgi:alanine-glyoxylate transaminase/serine-glyoxylate transaminase/serine-pyruvate transaminase
MSSSPITPRPRLLMGPGPSNVHHRVLAAMAQPTVGHLDPVFSDMMEEVKDLMRAVFRTKNALTIPLSGPGSVAMETCLVNLVSPGDEVIVCINGVFGTRMADIVTRCGATPVKVETPWGEPVDVDAVRAAIADHSNAKVLAFVHAETSTGVASDAAALCALGQEHGLLTIVDAVTSLGGIPVETDAWGADAIYSGTQKCLSCPPGLSLLTMSDRAQKAMKARNAPAQSWFMDLALVMAYWDGEGGRTYHHTAPVNAVYGLYQALLDVQAEGLEARWQRHRTCHEALVDGLAGLGLSLPVAPEARLPQLNLVTIPDGADDAGVRKALLSDHGIEIGAGLGAFVGTHWRIGLMGETAQTESVNRLILALGAVLSGQG